MSDTGRTRKDEPMTSSRSACKCAHTHTVNTIQPLPAQNDNKRSPILEALPTAVEQWNTHTHGHTDGQSHAPFPCQRGSDGETVPVIPRQRRQCPA